MDAVSPSYKGYRYPAEVIAHCVWLYDRFPLSFREVEELMLARGAIVSYETIRQWCAKFGPTYARALRRRRPRAGDKWHLDEVFVKINGEGHYLWRAAGQDGNVLAILVQSRRDAKAARRSYGVAHREMIRSVEHRQIEVPEQPGGELPPAHPAARPRDEGLPLTRRCSAVPLGLQRDLAALPAPPPPPHRTAIPRSDDRPLTTWNEIIGLPAAA